MYILSLNITGGDYILWFIIGGVCLLCLWVYVLQLKYSVSQKNDRLRREAYIKEDSIKITVTFDDCKVKEKKSYSVKPSSNGYRSQGLNSLLDCRNAQTATQNKYYNIEAKAKANGTTKTFKVDNLPFDRETLLIKLYIQKEITIYCNKHLNSYLFDLSFLD